MSLPSKTITCPFCGHPMHVQIDDSNGDQDYIEDCTNCCHPIHFKIHRDEVHNKVQLIVSSDDEQLY